MTKLSVNEVRRLREVKANHCTRSTSMRATTDGLIERGFLELHGRKVSKTGRLVHAGKVTLTEAGLAALAERANG